MTGLYRSLYSNPGDLEATVQALRERSARFGEVFLAGALTPRPTLWRIREGAAVDVHASGREAIGDLDSYNLYLQREDRLQHPASTGFGSEDLELAAIIQWHANVDDGPTERNEHQRSRLQAFTGQTGARFDRTVGGYVTQVVTGQAGFEYCPWTQRTPERIRHRPVLLNGTPGLLGRTLGPGHIRYTLAGGPPTPHAVGFCLPRSGTGTLYPNDRPWDTVHYINLESIGDFIQRAAADYGQVLVTGEWVYENQQWEPDVVDRP
jgi:hypothetical protein